jgi:hypothetical protein
MKGLGFSKYPAQSQKAMKTILKGQAWRKPKAVSCIADVVPNDLLSPLQ